MVQEVDRKRELIPQDFVFTPRKELPRNEVNSKKMVSILQHKLKRTW